MAPASDKLLKSMSLSDRVRDRLRAAILEGELKPGDKINIEKVAGAFGISRTPIREGLKALETEGLVQIHPNRGAIVAPMVWAEIHHRYRMRGLLEGYAAELACAQSDKELIGSLKENCAAVKRLNEAAGDNNITDVMSLGRLNRDFHRIIWAASGSFTLLRFLEALDLPQSFNESFYDAENARDIVCRHHDEIMGAFLEGDAHKAGALMTKHIHDAAGLVASQAQIHVGNLCC